MEYGPMIPEEVGREMSDTLKNIESALRTGLNNGMASDDIYLAMLDGTKPTYDRAMRAWFKANGSDVATTEQLTALVDKWYRLTRTKWIGGNTFVQPSVANPSEGTKYGDNEGLTATPSTESQKSVDDYEGLNLFATKDCNWILSDTGEILITAIDGITDNFERHNPEKFVGVLQQSMFVLRREDDATYSVGISAHKVSGYDYCKPLKEAVKKDGTMREWVCHTKYQAGMVNSKPTACSGVIPTTESHNSDVSDSHVLGQYYSATCHCDYDFLELMKQIKYGLASDYILTGCCDYYKNAYVALAETGVKRVLLSSNPGFVVGSCVKVATITDDSKKTDRGVSGTVCNIRSIEDVTIGDVVYKAVNLDVSNTIDTVLNEDITLGKTVIMTMPWMTGSTDLVEANDGGINPKSPVYPVKIQGIEYMLGQYEVIEDTILQYEADGKQYEYIISDATKEATSITADFVKHGGSPVPETSSWRYIKKMGFDDGIFYPLEFGGSSSTGHKDQCYLEALTSGVRELLCFGSLRIDVASAGMSSSYRSSGLSSRYWYFGSRLSPNGNRGEWA